jgi:ABC-2 type transport system ATP-binding protein
LLAIETKGLTRRFGKTIAVQNLNLQVPAGALFGLIGPNGAGKTTTLRMLAGLLEPSSGEILLNGQRASRDWHELRWQIGYMPDFYGVYEDLLVWEYLDFFARCYGLPAIRRPQMIEELLELVDLGQKRDTYVQTLSRGMRQRLCLAHALVHEPQVLLLDEPASGLDPRARVEMRELLRELANLGKTIVVSSHILTELAELCDSIGILEKGQMVASGSLAEISAQTRQSHMLRLKVLSDLDSAKAAIGGVPGVDQIFEVNGFLEVEFRGDIDAVADFLETILAQGVRVASYSPVTSDLEEIFLRLTTGEVA